MTAIFEVMFMKTGLVLEGGACRGVFTSGVLDEMMEWGLRFPYCIGVSAGAGNAMNFTSRQQGRALEVVAGLGGKSYYGLKTARATGKMLDLDWVYDTMSFEGDHPFDFDAYYENPMETEYTLTCCETGKAEYFSERVYRKRLIEIVKASCSMPGICPVAVIEGKHYLDGGIADPLPVRHAFSRGCDQVLLITTKPREDLHPTDYRKMRHVLHRLYGRRYPLLYDALMDRIPRYFEEMAWIEEQEKEGRVLTLRPRFCDIRSLEKDREKMHAYYAQGREIGKENREKIEAFLQ